MKMRRILALLTCLVLLLSFSSMAFAAAYDNFFVETVFGYRCTGSGRINGMTGRSVFFAEMDTSLLQPIQPAACSCEVWVYAFDPNGRLLGAHLNNEGTVSATAEYTATQTIGRIECSFTFNDVDLGYYRLNNS